MGKGKLALYTLTFIMALILSGCGAENETNSTGTKSDGKITVYTTVYPLADFAKKIGGDYVDVESIYPPGVDEHSYEPTQKEIIEMANGDLFLAIGYNLEGFVEKAQPILEDEGVKVVAVGEQVNIENHEDEEEHAESEDDGHDHGSVDPHIWLDPVYAIELAQSIKDNLIEIMPDQKATFEKNYESLASQLEELNTQFIEVTENAKVKEFIVSHAAYGYWEERYGIKQLNISGISTSQEPSQKQLMEIVDEVKANHLNYILVEQNVNNNLVDVIQSETDISTLPIHNLSVLTENDIENGEDYFSIMEKNLETLKTALNE